MSESIGTTLSWHRTGLQRSRMLCMAVGGTMSEDLYGATVTGDSRREVGQSPGADASPPYESRVELRQTIDIVDLGFLEEPIGVPAQFIEGRMRAVVDAADAVLQDFARAIEPRCRLAGVYSHLQFFGKTRQSYCVAKHYPARIGEISDCGRRRELRCLGVSTERPELEIGFVDRVIVVVGLVFVRDQGHGGAGVVCFAARKGNEYDEDE
ncbi:hypothetical protein P171DRAFT_445647 [Karstenula rhodostoma CBS 690.94]|uniref:Uncharacterized protein n=1 Tax=Karstenula rhodostoma CBS 690.94 TaxID=1392251 RepID=A0A9P4U983_9PLEO|nr:hypothetical protein P171DRAFT_445647 [Karstenula rhodostoma CBS 690.94]